MAYVVEDENSWRYQKDLPLDRTKITKGWDLLASYSGIHSEEIDQHVMTLRDKGFAVFPYACLGRWRFLDLYITNTPWYPDLISRLKADDKLLDIGCCFGHILRQLAVDGAPPANLAGADLRPEFIELGYELFRDKDKFPARFVTGNIFNPQDEGLATLDGGFDIVHAASFFHLFVWDDQVKVGERIVRFLKTDAEKAVILGRQVGALEPVSPEIHRERGERRYLHSVETMQAMWDLVGDKTGTTWKVTGDMTQTTFDDAPRVIIRFAVFRQEQSL